MTTPPLRELVYPPLKGSLYCIACFWQGIDVKRLHVTAQALAVTPPTLLSAVQEIGGRSAICARCYSVLAEDGDEALRQIIGHELLSTHIEPQLIASAFMEAELGLTMALWWLGAASLGALTPGLRVWVELVDRFPKLARLSSESERDLGNGVYAAFSNIAGGLWIGNIVSRDRRKGYAKEALRRICKIADAHGSDIMGKVEANAPPGYTIGAPYSALMRSYARFGFEQLPYIGATIIRRPAV